MVKDLRRIVFKDNCIKQLHRLATIFNRLDKLRDELKAQTIIIESRIQDHKKVSQRKLLTLKKKIKALEKELDTLHGECFEEIEYQEEEEEEEVEEINTSK